jgi:hypothetical protein
MINTLVYIIARPYDHWLDSMMYCKICILSVSVDNKNLKKKKKKKKIVLRMSQIFSPIEQSLINLNIRS